MDHNFDFLGKNEKQEKCLEFPDLAEQRVPRARTRERGPPSALAEIFFILPPKIENCGHYVCPVPSKIVVTMFTCHFPNHQEFAGT